MTDFAWNPDAHLSCARCGETAEMGAAASCSCGHWREVAYGEPPSGAMTLTEAAGWLRRHRQVLVDGAQLDMGQGRTPLVSLPRLGERLLLKDESANPTWSHKDRANGTNAAVARLRGSAGMVAQTTGNHGASVAAFAAAAGIGSVILCRPGMPPETTAMILAYGGLPVDADADTGTHLLPALIEAGYHAATSMDVEIPGCSNPYGAEAYKLIAGELVEQLGTMPSTVVVPVASGDTLYGVAKGFAELASATSLRQPLILAVQPTQANPLQRSLEAGHEVEVPDADSVAFSIANTRTGEPSLDLLRGDHARIVSVTEAEIGSATADMHRAGHYLESASSASLAGLRRAVQLGYVDEAGTTVLLGTASATKWQSRQGDASGVEPLPAESLPAELDRLNLPVPALGSPVGG